MVVLPLRVRGFNIGWNRFEGMDSDNDPYFSWPLDSGERAREVWYSLVSHPDLPVGFWYRYTLLSTDSGHQEARVWAALSRRGSGADGDLVTRSSPLESAEVEGDPFRLSVEDNELTSHSAKGSVEGIEWDLSYEPDERTFVPLEGDGMGGETGDHWSANQSVEMTGTVQVDGETYHFEDAPGHQGHTVGTAAPPSWSWTHANSFGDDADTVVEALEFAGMATVCFRHDGDMYALNTMDQILEGNRSVENEPGRWVFKGESDEIELRVEVEVDADEDSERWKKAAYLTPDDTVRYVAHASLADVRVVYETEDEEETLGTDSGRVEWAGKVPPVGEKNEYAPEEFARKG